MTRIAAPRRHDILQKEKSHPFDKDRLTLFTRIAAPRAHDTLNKKRR